MQTCLRNEQLGSGEIPEIPSGQVVKGIPTQISWDHSGGVQGVVQKMVAWLRGSQRQRFGLLGWDIREWAAPPPLIARTTPAALPRWRPPRRAR